MRTGPNISTWALLLPSKKHTTLNNSVTVMTFGGWAIFVLAILASFALLLKTGSASMAHPVWLSDAGLGGAASFILGTLLHPFCVAWLPKLYYRHT